MRKIVWDDLPQDIASRILGKLAWSERARLCLVCKSWRRLFYEIKNTQEFLPWIFCYNSDLTSDGVRVCKLCDPFARRSYTVKDAAIVKNRDFSDARACDSRYGWVLFSKEIYDTVRMNFFLYNPFTNEIIELPRMEKNYRKITCYEKATFSLSPSSPSCTVIAFSILRDGKLGIETCQPGDEFWKMFEFLGDYKYNSILDVAYADESFYCTFVEGKMGAFNIKQQQWKVLTESLHRSGNCHHCLVVAFDGDLLLYWPCTEPIYDVIHTCCWRFDLSEMKWIESKKKQVIFEKCTSFSVPAMGNAKGSEGDYYFGSSFWRKPNYAWTLEDDIHFRGRIWIQPPFQYSSGRQIGYY
ncbi:hypothetical protein LWI29_014541 [Acer saccharum]|uniref:F-box domain-containing protein n=1 Tax=Acer saccharum TaxID=4024 RepID=A0AA39W1P4_ACESA|nr:hypothetical protein LWI29_014541 [Acer saccharum]